MGELVQELGIQVIAIDGKNLRVPMTESLALRHCILSVRGRRNIGWCWHRAKCRISRMKLQPLPYWNCLTLKAVLSPLMPWAPKTIAAQIQRAQADYILCLKANHPTLFQQIDTWFETARAEGTLPIPSEHTAEAGHHRTEIRKVWTFSLDPLPPCIRQRNGWDCKQLSSSNVPAITTQFSSGPVVNGPLKIPALDARCHLW